MPSTYTTNLGIEKIASGEQSGTWGDTTNTNWDMMDEAVNGIISVTLAATGSTGTPNDIPITDGASSQGRNKFIEFTDGGDLGGTAYVRITPNDAEKIVHIRNSLSGSRDIIAFQGTYNASNDFVIPAGADVLLKFDGGGAGATVTDVFVNLTPTGLTVTNLTVDTLTATTYVGLPAADLTTSGTVELATVAETNTGTDATRAVTPDGLDGWLGSAQIETLGTVATGTWQGDVIAEAYLQNQSGTNTGDEPDASTTVKGIVELATVGETNTGTDATRAVTPDGLDGWTGSAQLTTVGTIASGTWQGNAISTTYVQNLSGTNTGDEVTATETTEGIVEIATQAEVDAGIETDKVVTPATLAAFSGGGDSLSSLTDTTITSVTEDEILQWDGVSKWINQTLAEAGIAGLASPTFTGTVTIPTADINGGTIDGASINSTSIGASTASTGEFTTLTATTYNGLPTADLTTSGIVELATVAETNTGTDATRAVTPDGLDGWTGSGQIATVGTIANGTWQGNAISTTYVQNLSGTNTGDEVTATFTSEGIVEIATQAEVDAGTDTVRVVTPDTLANYSGLGAGTIAALTDTDITSVTNGELLVWSNTDWINQTLAEAGIAGLASPTFTGTVTAPTLTANTTLTAGGTVNFSGATVSDLGSVTTADINGGTIDGTSIGNGSADTGNFTTLSINGTAITATADELNIMDGVTASATEINYNDITTLGTVQANKTVTAGATEINFNNFNMTNVDINSGAIDGTIIGAGTAANGTFDTLSATTYSGLPAASTTAQGIVERATQTEVDTGTDTSRYVTPETLSNYAGLGGTFDPDSVSTITTSTTLTTSSSYVQRVNGSDGDSSIILTLPNATTYSAVGGNKFEIVNVGISPVAIEANGGELVGYLFPSKSTLVTLADKSTAAGVWELAGGMPMGYAAFGVVTVGSGADTQREYQMLEVATDKYLILYTDSVPDLYAVIYNHNTRVFGSPVTVRTGVEADEYLGLVIGTDKALVSSAIGTALEAVVLSVSTNTITVNTAATQTVSYVGANYVAFIESATSGSYVSLHGSSGNIMQAMTVSGTTVTLGSQVVGTNSAATGWVTADKIIFAPAQSGFVHGGNAGSGTGTFLDYYTVSGTTISVGSGTTLDTNEGIADNMAQFINLGRWWCETGTDEWTMYMGTDSSTPFEIHTYTLTTGTVSVLRLIDSTVESDRAVHKEAGIFYCGSGKIAQIDTSQNPVKANIATIASGVATVGTSLSVTKNADATRAFVMAGNSSYAHMMEYDHNDTGGTTVHTVFDISGSVPTVTGRHLYELANVQQFQMGMQPTSLYVDGGFILQSSYGQGRGDSKSYYFKYGQTQPSIDLPSIPAIQQDNASVSTAGDYHGDWNLKNQVDASWLPQFTSNLHITMKNHGPTSFYIGIYEGTKP